MSTSFQSGNAGNFAAQIRPDNVDEASTSESTDLLASVHALVSQRRRSDPMSQNNETALEVELNVYIAKSKSFDHKSDPLKFWTDRKEKLPLMFDVAVDILAVPATTAPVERVFSRASYILSKKRHNLSDDKLEIELLCRMNGDVIFE